jgi:hypothetical protein
MVPLGTTSLKIMETDNGNPAIEMGATASQGSFTMYSNGNTNIKFLGAGPAFMKNGVKLGLGTATPATGLDVEGDSQFGSGATKSTFTIAGGLFIASGSSITLSGANGFIASQSSVTASAFFGDGSHLTGIVSTGSVLLAGVTVPGALLNLSTYSFTGETNTFTSSKTITGAGGLGVTYGLVAATGSFSTNLGIGVASTAYPLEVKSDRTHILNTNTTSTLSNYNSFVNGGGTSFMGKDNSTGSEFGLAYADVWYGDSTHDIVLYPPNASVRLKTFAGTQLYRCTSGTQTNMLVYGSGTIAVVCTASTATGIYIP